MASEADHAENLTSFVAITSATAEQAAFYLAAANNDLQLAISTFYETSAPAVVAPRAAGLGGLSADDIDDEMDDDDMDEEPAAAASAAPVGRENDRPAFGQAGASNPLGAFGRGPTGAPMPTVAPAAAAASGGARTWGAGNSLSGANVAAPGAGSYPSSASSSRASTPSNPMRSNQAPRVSTLRDLNSGSSAPAPRAGGFGGFGGTGRVANNNDEDDEDDDDDEEREQAEFFTGGEKSGLSVENPNAGRGSSKANDIIKGILQKAKDGGARIAGDPPAGPAQSRSVFSGSANTLGSDDTPSVHIPKPSASGARVPGGFPGTQEDDDEDEPERGEVVTRNLTFWEDGFSIEDGDLMRYDDPVNAEILKAIDSGRAPLSLLNVRHDQPVELRIAKHLKEKWSRQPAAPAGPFAGSGNRLGSESSPLSAAPAAAAPSPIFSALSQSFAAGTSDERSGASVAGETLFVLDPSMPTTTLQLRLRDGTRLVAKFNHSHTVGDVRRYINASQPGQAVASYALQTTFPSRDLTDDSQTLADANLLGSVVVQRGL